MKNIVTKALVAATSLYLLSFNALAVPEGCGTRFACEVPEPGTPYLFLGAVGVAALVIKLRKKK